MTRAVVAILGIILVGVVGIWGFQAALADAGDDRVVVNESWTPNAGSATQLENSGRTGAYYGNETTVYNATDAEMDRGVDYTWFETNGTVKALTGGDLAGDASATITYTYQQTTSDQRALADIVGQLPTVMGIIVPLLGVALLFIFLKQ